jgi:hypothetical protein
MAARYAAVIRAEAARAVGLPRDLPPETLDPLLDRLRPERAGAPFSALLAEAKAARTDADLMRVAARLHRWKVEMTCEPG